MFRFEISLSIVCSLKFEIEIKGKRVADFDIVIIGSGIIGLATACALGGTPLKIAVVDDKKILLDLPLTPRIRASAINMSSQSYFSDMGIWDSLLASGRVLTFQDISVREKHGFASFDAHSHDYHYDNLGHIIENDLIIKTMYEHIQCHANIHFFPNKVECLSIDTQNAIVYLNNQSQLNAQLIVAADGPNSWVRHTIGAKIWQYAYRHHAIISTVETEKSHNACARQLFYPEGIVAFLPLWNAHQSCLVWSAKPEQAVRLQNLTSAEFNDRLTEMTHGWLGQCELMNDRNRFPLTARYTLDPVRHRLILIGDASHTIHPLAGQGANLGLRDSRQLARTIVQLQYQGKDIGLKRHWMRYQSGRHKDVLTMLAGMQTIETLFDGKFVLKKWMRGLGMNLIDRMPRIKKQLLKYALGL